MFNFQKQNWKVWQNSTGRKFLLYWMLQSVRTLYIMSKFLKNWIVFFEFFLFSDLFTLIRNHFYEAHKPVHLRWQNINYNLCSKTKSFCTFSKCFSLFNLDDTNINHFFVDDIFIKETSFQFNVTLKNDSSFVNSSDMCNHMVAEPKESGIFRLFVNF